MEGKGSRGRWGGGSEREGSATGGIGWMVERPGYGGEWLEMTGGVVIQFLICSVTEDLV